MGPVDIPNISVNSRADCNVPRKGGSQGKTEAEPVKIRHAAKPFTADSKRSLRRVPQGASALKSAAEVQTLLVAGGRLIRQRVGDTVDGSPKIKRIGGIERFSPARAVPVIDSGKIDRRHLCFLVFLQCSTDAQISVPGEIFIAEIGNLFGLKTGIADQITCWHKLLSSDFSGNRIRTDSAETVNGFPYTEMGIAVPSAVWKAVPPSETVTHRTSLR